jgi:predicted nuclease of predicted toxin-antitoxin system
MRFLVDENLPYEIAAILTEHGHEVTYVPDSNLRGADDAGLWRAAAEGREILVTQDLDFPLDIQPIPPGVLILRMPHRWKVTQVAALFAETVGQLVDLEGAITVVTPGRVRRRGLPDA